MLNEREIFARWAPKDRFWSAWAKPSLFLSLNADASTSSPVPEAVSTGGQIPDPRDGIALLVELNGARSIACGLQAAQMGYQPVPLFNCCTGATEAVFTAPLREKLAQGALALAASPPPRDAPPAFLIDRLRLGGTRRPQPGEYDNRWMVFPQDFPSAETLKARRIRGVLWINERIETPEADLAHVLYGWQQGGLEIRAAACGEEPRGSAALQISRPSGFGSLWHRALALLGLRRNSAGGFGSLIPTPSSGGGGFAGGGFA
jgi:hypothetical protein